MKYARLKKLYAQYRIGKSTTNKGVDIAKNIAPLLTEADDVTDEEFIEVCYLAYSPHKIEPNGVNVWLKSIDENKRATCRHNIHDGIKKFYKNH